MSFYEDETIDNPMTGGEDANVPATPEASITGEATADSAAAPTVGSEDEDGAAGGEETPTEEPVA